MSDQGTIEPGVYEDVDNLTYHDRSGPWGRDLMDNSRLGKMEVPAKFYQDMIEPPDSTPPMVFGNAAHVWVWQEEDWEKEVAVFSGASWRGKAAGEFRGINSDKLCILEGDVEPIREIKRSIMGHPMAGKLVRAEGPVELSIAFEIAGEPFRARLDKVIPSLGMIVDLKTTQCADPEVFGKSIYNYGYYRQAAVYKEAAKTMPDFKFEDFIFICVEKEPPYLVSTVRITPEEILLGHAQVLQFIDRLMDCRATDTWPGYSDEIETVEMPGWARDRLMRSCQHFLQEVVGEDDYDEDDEREPETTEKGMVEDGDENDGG